MSKFINRQKMSNISKFKNILTDIFIYIFIYIYIYLQFVESSQVYFQHLSIFIYICLYIYLFIQIYFDIISFFLFIYLVFVGPFVKVQWGAQLCHNLLHQETKW